MENFWRWLIRANARAVFLCALIALLAVCAWYAMRALKTTTVADLTPAVQAGTRPPQKSQARLGIISYLDQQCDADRSREGLNPFFVPRAPVSTNITTSFIPAATSTTTTATTALPPVKPKDILKVTYKGYFVRSDGRMAGHIQDSKGGSSVVNVSNKVCGLTITGITQEEVRAAMADGAEVILKLNKTETFEDGQHVK